MKLRIYPKKSVILEALCKRREEAASAYEETLAQYNKLHDSPLVHNNLDGIRTLKDMAADGLAAIELKIALVNSHVTEEVATEIEV